MVVQRYGEDVPGGAEHLARWVAEGLAARSHDVEVVTSRARSYLTWADHTAPGTGTQGGVTVHRLSVDPPRDLHRFDRLSGRVDFWSRGTHPVLESSWIAEQGPTMPTLGTWLDASVERFDLAILYTYLYATTTIGIERLAGRLPVVLHATAHEEPPIHLRRLQANLRQATELWCSTPEEAELLDRITNGRVPTRTIGIGVEPDRSLADGDLSRRLRGATTPYITAVGRVDPSKGVDELVRYFRTFKERHPSELTLVVIGDRVHELEGGQDVTFTGFLPESEMNHLVARSELFVQPSYFESFSLALCEAWLGRRAALVNGNCDVLDGQARRSGGGLSYRSYREFEGALELLLESPATRAAMGAAGADFVISNYEPGVVLDRIERCASDVVARQADRPVSC